MYPGYFGRHVFRVRASNEHGWRLERFVPAFATRYCHGRLCHGRGAGVMSGTYVGAALVVQPQLGWRWIEYFLGILQITVLIVDVIFLDDSCPPRLLVYKARRLRHQSGHWALHAKFEEWDVSIGEVARKVGVTNAISNDNSTWGHGRC
ncbi:hypothetical protein CLCR_00943 [Cladophialophora carrionii]|uniref:Major facilitator superfamily (MFS) profile domain-containing protein n=1 Tax=Cladophialophora carrionii TaxID=86049 RepID=A0A1C1D0S9_9EURO|nr:hypothetical protein CLCR_00943 [Cladophialophora carrionii]